MESYPDKGVKRYSRQARRPLKAGAPACYNSGTPGAAQAALAGKCYAAWPQKKCDPALLQQ